MEYLTRNEFADAIGVCYSTLDNWLRRGWITPVFVNPSGRKFFSKEQVESYYRGKYTPKGGNGNED